MVRTDLAVYVKLATTLRMNGLGEGINCLVCNLESGDGGEIPQKNGRGRVRLVRAVVEAERVESLVRIYEMMMRSGCGSTRVGDDR